jgi:ferredoxin
MLYIHPGECIDCSACMAECPCKAIFRENDLPEEWVPYRDLNATMARQCTRVARGGSRSIQPLAATMLKPFEELLRSSLGYFKSRETSSGQGP